MKTDVQNVSDREDTVQGKKGCRSVADGCIVGFPVEPVKKFRETTRGGREGKFDSPERCPFGVAAFAILIGQNWMLLGSG